MGCHFDDSLPVSLLTGDIKQESLEAREECGMGRATMTSGRKLSKGANPTEVLKKLGLCSKMNDRSLNGLEI
jgi:hypothetical protein